MCFFTPDVDLAEISALIFPLELSPPWYAYDSVTAGNVESIRHMLQCIQ
jgi:hypothetical protein